MSDIKSPSSIISTFVREVNRDFPSEECGKVKAHEEAIAKTTTENDGHRARMCAAWAIEIVKKKDSEHPRWKEIKQLHQEWSNTVFAGRFALSSIGPEGRLGPIGDVEILWTEDAVHLAKNLADEDGWSEVPWEDLLVAMIVL